MISRLSPDLDEPKSPMGVEPSRGEHFEEIGLTDVVRAGAGDENSAGPQHLEGAEIQLLVAAECGVEIALGFGESGWVEDDGVVAASLLSASRGGIVLEQVEGIGFDPFNLLCPQKRLIESGILFGDLERRAGAVDGRNLRAARGEM